MSNCFNYKQGLLYAEEVSLADIEDAYGSPCYIYSKTAIQQAWQRYARIKLTQDALICYAVKANSNLAVLKTLVQLGAGFDIVSGGELARCLAAGAHPSRIVYSGVGKTKDEIRQAMDAGVYLFNVESLAELEVLSNIALAKQSQVHIALRINPDINVVTHPYIATGLQEHKFGLTIKEALSCLKWLKQHAYLKLLGLACHIGSEIQSIEPFQQATECLLSLIHQCSEQGVPISVLNLGGGLGINVDNNPQALSIEQWCDYLSTRLSGLKLKLILEPGRSIVGSAGGLLTRVLYIKDNGKKRFAIVDAGMNDFIRPALYDATHPILPVKQILKTTKHSIDVVGPVCESADFLLKNVSLPIKSDDLLLVNHVGAYGFSMSSHYNSRPKVAEVMVKGNQHYLIRRREQVESLFELEQTVTV